MENQAAERYQKPWMEIIELEDDIILTSGGREDEIPDMDIFG